jgi:hypothetical protein
MATLVVVAADTPTGTIHIHAAITTPVATPTGMTTYGLVIVVKFSATRSLNCSGMQAGPDFTSDSLVTCYFA